MSRYIVSFDLEHSTPEIEWDGDDLGEIIEQMTPEEIEEVFRNIVYGMMDNGDDLRYNLNNLLDDFERIEDWDDLREAFIVDEIGWMMEMIDNRDVIGYTGGFDHWGITIEDTEVA